MAFRQDYPREKNLVLGRVTIRLSTCSPQRFDTTLFDQTKDNIPAALPSALKHLINSPAPYSMRSRRPASTFG